MRIYRIEESDRETELGAGFDKFLNGHIKANNKTIKDVSSEEFDLLCDTYMHQNEASKQEDEQ